MSFSQFNYCYAVSMMTADALENLDSPLPPGEVSFIPPLSPIFLKTDIGQHYQSGPLSPITFQPSPLLSSIPVLDLIGCDDLQFVPYFPQTCRSTVDYSCDSSTATPPLSLYDYDDDDEDDEYR